MNPLGWTTVNGIPVNSATGQPLRLRVVQPPGSGGSTAFGAGNRFNPGAGLAPMSLGGGNGLFPATGNLAGGPRPVHGVGVPNLGGGGMPHVAPLDDNWYPRFKRKVTGHELRSPIDKWALSEYVFRGAGPTSGGINTPQGLIAGMYKQLPMNGVPSMDDIGRRGGRWFMTQRELEHRTLSHFSKINNMPTPWISTTSSLEKALSFLIQFCPHDGFIFVIRVSDCRDIYDAPVVTDALPGIADTLDGKWQPMIRDHGSANEYIVFGKIPAHAIAATISSRRLLECESLYTISPPLALEVERRIQKRPSQMVLNMLREGPSHRLEDIQLRAAVEVVSRFENADELCFFWIVRVLLGSDFQGAYVERYDGRRVRQAVEGFLLGRIMLQDGG